MKRIKISIIAVFSIVIGTLASAFTANFAHVSNHEKLITTWFQFMGSDPTNLSQVQDYQNYSYQTGQACSGANKICAVYVDGTPTVGQPPAAPFSSSLKTELQNVILHGNSYSDISKKP